ncbi:MAG: hypothetical protein R2851_11690 [Caldilineaceae bacterium]
MGQRIVPIDAAILTVKSYDTATALDELSGAGPDGPPHARWGRQPPERRGQRRPSLPASTLRTQSGRHVGHARLRARGGRQIRIDKPRFTMGLSRWSPAVDARPVLADLHDALAGAGFRVTAFGDAPGMKWTKPLMNMIGNALHQRHPRPGARPDLCRQAPGQSGDRRLARGVGRHARSGHSRAQRGQLPFRHAGAAHPLRAQAHVAHGVATAGG